MLIFFFFKQKTAYEMRISDWSSDVCSSDLAKNIAQAYEWVNYVHSPEVSAKVADGSGYNPVVKGADKLLSDVARKNFEEAYPEIGRASCRERVCQYV